MTRRAAGALVALIVPAGIALHLHAQSGSGATHVIQTSYLKASNPEADDHFGCGGVLQGHTGQGVAVSADGTTLAVGAPHESGGSPGINGNQRDNSAFDAGAVYVFIRKGDHWTQQAYVKPSNPRSSAEFGHTPAPGYKSALDPVSNQLKVMVTVHTFKLLSLGLNAQIRAFGNWNSVAQFGVADGSKLTGVHLEASLQPGIEATPYELVTGSGEKFHGFGLAVGDIDLSNDDADLDLINAPTDWVLDAINYPTIY